MNESTAYITGMGILMHVLPILVVLIVTALLVYYINRNNKWLTGFIKSQINEFDELKEYLTSHEERIITSLIKVIKDSNTVTPDNSNNVDNNYYQLYDVFKKVGSIATNKLSSIMEDINAYRIAIYLFHNGTRTLSGFDFLKMTCIGERIKIRSGIKEHMMDHANININILDDMYDNLFTSGRYIIINDASISNTNKAMFISSPLILYSQLVALYDENNNIIGFLLAEFNHSYNKLISEDEYNVLKEACVYLSPIFIYTDYTSLTLKSEITDTD